MPNITLSVPEELKQKMDEMPEINWSEVIRGMLGERLRRLSLLKRLDELTAGSRLTDEDVKAISAKVKEGIAKRHGL